MIIEVPDEVAADLALVISVGLYEVVRPHDLTNEPLGLIEDDSVAQIGKIITAIKSV